MAAATDATLAEIATSPEETVTSPEEIATSPEETDTEVVEIAEEEEIVGVRREDPRQGDRLPGGNTQDLAPALPRPELEPEEEEQEEPEDRGVLIKEILPNYYQHKLMMPSLFGHRMFPNETIVVYFHTSPFYLHRSMQAQFCSLILIVHVFVVSVYFPITHYT